MAAEENLIQKKLVIVGDSMPGKHQLPFIKAEGKFLADTDILYGVDFFKKTIVEVDNQRVKLLMFLPTGGELFHTIRPIYYRGSSVFLICFAIDDVKSFDNALAFWKDEIKTHCPTVPIILTGLKKELRTEAEETELISYDVARAGAETIQAWAYMECSTKTGDGVDELFQIATRASLTFPSPESSERTNEQPQRKCAIL